MILEPVIHYTLHELTVVMMRDILFRNKTPARLNFTEEEEIRHDTIHRAWQLHLRYQRERRERELEKQYNKMREACTDLEQHDIRLFKAAMTKDKNAGFPIEMRSMTDTPPKNGWNHDWKAKVEEKI